MSQIPARFYESLKSLAVAAITGLSIITLINFLSAVACLSETVIGGFSSIINFLSAIKPLSFLLTLIFFLIWINRANKNLTALKADNLEFTSGWAVGWWFVPFANLVKPFQVVKEIWIQSDPDFDSDLQFLAGGSSAPFYISAWWFFWIISNIWANFISRANPTDVESYNLYLYSWTVNAVLFCIAGLLAIKLVWDITQRQEKRFQRIASLGQNFQEPPPPPSFN